MPEPDYTDSGVRRRGSIVHTYRFEVGYVGYVIRVDSHGQFKIIKMYTKTSTFTKI